ncbi:MAG: hypothetical protein QM731_11845 [Chitinophagaceae bacterium]
MPDKKISITPFLLFHITAVVCIGIFVCWHAFTMGIAFDETYSLKLVKEHYYRAMPGSANTHWLNTFFMIIEHSIFGDSRGWLRLHSILAFPFFAHGVYVLLKNNKNLFIAFAGYCFIVFNPYLIDFFSLARGYSLALTFQAWMLVYLIRAGSQQRFVSREWLLVLLFSALSVASNLTYVYSAITALVVLLSCAIYFHPDGYQWKNRQLRITISLFTLLIVLSFADLLFMKYYARTLEYGGENLIASVFESVVHRSLYKITDVFEPGIIGYITFITVVGISLFGVIQATSTKTLSPLLSVSILLLIIITCNYLFHLLFKSPYLYVRTAVQWYVPAIAAITFATSMVKAGATRGRVLVQRAACIALGVIMMIHFGIHANVYTCLEWMRTEDLYRAYKDLEKINPPSFVLHQKFDGLYVNYYKITDKDPITIPFTYFSEEQLTATDSSLNAILSKEQYIITFEPSRLITYLKENRFPFQVIKEYSHSGFKLIKIN